MVFRHMEELVTRARVVGRTRIAVARAEEPHVLEALARAYAEGLVEPVLFGDETALRAALEREDIGAGWEIRHVSGDDAAVAHAAAQAVGRGEAKLLMKGQMHTGTLLSAALHRENGLRIEGRFLSHLMLVEMAAYPKLFGTTDGGITIAPNFEQKRAIVRNTAETLRALGYEEPKIGLLSYVEKARKDEPETHDWQRIAEEAARGEYGRALIDGPLAMDLCLSPEAKALKGSQSPVAGDVDAIVTPTLTTCNAMTKGLVITGARIAGVVVGARAPIVVVSRGDKPEARYHSIALAQAVLAVEESA